MLLFLMFRQFTYIAWYRHILHNRWITRAQTVGIPVNHSRGHDPNAIWSFLVKSLHWTEILWKLMLCIAYDKQQHELMPQGVSVWRFADHRCNRTYMKSCICWYSSGAERGHFKSGKYGTFPGLCNNFENRATLPLVWVYLYILLRICFLKMDFFSKSNGGNLWWYL